jgi:hypothetical protein
MLAFVEIWYRPKRSADYRRHGTEQVAALLEAGAPMTIKVDGHDRRVTVDRAARTAISMVAAGTLWVTET